MIYDLIKATCFFPGILFSVQELLFYLEKFDIVTKKKVKGCLNVNAIMCASFQMFTYV